MSRKQVTNFLTRNLGNFLFVTALAGSIPLLVVASKLTDHDLTKDLLHDVGVALLVAAIVGGTYEIHSRIWFDSERFSELLTRIFGEFVTPEVWEEVRSQILERQMIRTQTHIHLRVLNSDHLPEGVKLLTMQIRYDAYGLGGRVRKLPIIHHLDSHIKYEHLPRFTEITVNGEKQGCELPEGKFVKRVKLDRRDGKPVRVFLEREQATYVPGFYTLSMREITRDLTIHLQDLPDDFEASMNIFPDIENEQLEVNRDREFPQVILLPGQTIEFRFKRKS